MRVFATYLGIDQSLLSKVMRGERKVSEKTETHLALRLGLKPNNLLQKRNAKPSQFNLLADDEFQALSEWYHFAILELAKTTDFKPDAHFIAKRLGLHVDETRSAIERLERLGFIEVTGDQWRLCSPNNTWSNNQVTSEARRHLQKTLRELNLNALDHVPFSDRDDGSLTVAIAKNRMPEFKEKLKEIRRELDQFFSEGASLDEVYQLTISLFPLTKSKGASDVSFTR